MVARGGGEQRATRSHSRQCDTNSGTIPVQQRNTLRTPRNPSSGIVAPKEAGSSPAGRQLILPGTLSWAKQGVAGRMSRTLFLVSKRLFGLVKGAQI
jgi:hypothetical protein